MKTEIKLITPDVATLLLNKNNMNRPLRNRLVNEYSRLMVCGLWKEETGESIKIAIDGSILDGQHRLAAIIKSNISLSFLLITDLEKEIFTVLDTGVVRTAGDILHIAGVSQSNNIAAAIAKYMKLKKGNTSVIGQKSGGLKDYSISKGELYTLYSQRIAFWEAALSMGDRWYNKFNRVMSLSELISLYAFFFDIDADDAFKFIELLCEGVDMKRTNPVFLLREKLIFSKTNTKFCLIASQKLAIIYKAWNYFRSREDIKILRFNYDLDNFPIPI